MFVCFFEGYVDVVADVALTNEFGEAVVLKYMTYFFVYAGEDDCDARAMALLNEVLKVVHTC